ncbi:MAG TPA: hypothetical protein VMY42_26500 [Thermoguttaceae bacterium]|nr:hypothetical protein [Thermoguttaceae bacterium]
MGNAADTQAIVFKNGTATCLARVVGNDAANLVQADISAASYSIYLLDDDDADSRTAVTGHAAVSLTVADLLFDSLQTDALWTADATGYNFRHAIDISTDVAFAIAGRRYLVEFTLTPVTGQTILIRFRLNII